MSLQSDLLRTLLAGIGPAPREPYAHSGCIVSLRFSPGHMSKRPWSQPLITWPWPTVKLKGWPRLYVMDVDLVAGLGLARALGGGDDFGLQVLR
jgi:hypothetical protein